MKHAGSNILGRMVAGSVVRTTWSVLVATEARLTVKFCGMMRIKYSACRVSQTHASRVRDFYVACLCDIIASESFLGYLFALPMEAQEHGARVFALGTAPQTLRRRTHVNRCAPCRGGYRQASRDLTRSLAVEMTWATPQSRAHDSRVNGYECSRNDTEDHAQHAGWVV